MKTGQATFIKYSEALGLSRFCARFGARQLTKIKTDKWGQTLRDPRFFLQKIKKLEY